MSCRYRDCTAQGQQWEFTNGEYCSTEHYHRARARDVLDAISSDHRFCSSCYKPLKVVYRPEDRVTPQLRKKALIIRESFVGFQTMTEHASLGSFGIECSCGNVDHHHAEELCRDGEPYEWFLKEAITQLRGEGTVDYRFDIETFADTFWSDDDFELAVGHALSDA